MTRTERERREVVKRMDEMHVQLKVLEMKYATCVGVIEHCFEVMHSQADLIRAYNEETP